MNTSQKSVKWLTGLSLAGITLGVIAGVVVARWQPAGADASVVIADSIVRAWTNAFRSIVVPLVVVQLYVALAGNRDSGVHAGRLGLVIPATFAAILVFGAITSITITSVLLGLDWFGQMTLSAPPAALEAARAAATSSSAAWVDSFVPPNVFAAATTDNILPLMLFTMMFSLAMRRADVDAGDIMYRVSRGLSQAMFVLVGWLLLLTPIVMLALGFRSGMSSGIKVGEVIVAYALLEIAVVVAVTVLLAVATSLVAGIPLWRYVRALWPGQLTALASRSSLATIPTLMSSATSVLGIRAQTASTVLPMGGATLKMSRAVNNPVRLLFLAHVLGVDLTFERIVVFAISVIMLSAATVGVPTVVIGMRSLPAYIAAGIPAEYVALISVSVNLTDYFLTAINSSGYFSATAIVDRFAGKRAHAQVPIEVVTEIDAEQQPMVEVR